MGTPYGDCKREHGTAQRSGVTAGQERQPEHRDRLASEGVRLTNFNVEAQYTPNMAAPDVYQPRR